MADSFIAITGTTQDRDSYIVALKLGGSIFTNDGKLGVLLSDGAGLPEGMLVDWDVQDWSSATLDVVPQPNWAKVQAYLEELPLFVEPTLELVLVVARLEKALVLKDLTSLNKNLVLFADALPSEDRESLKERLYLCNVYGLSLI